MDERLFARLAEWLAAGPVVLASVLATRGAAPRKAGSRMLITAGESAFSIGGGLAEARVLEAARAMLAGGSTRAELPIDLGGGEGAAGVCGGTMRIGLRCWEGVEDRARAEAVAVELAAGREVVLAGEMVAGEDRVRLHPDPRLLIVGAGHCGQALCELAAPLDFERWVFDERAACFGPGRFAGAHCLHGPVTLLETALATPRPVFAVLLNRDYASDVAALEVLCRQPPAFLGMIGSRRRIREVRAALPQHAAVLAALCAPIGIEIGAETPQEIAVSVLAQLIAHRRGAAAAQP